MKIEVMRNVFARNDAIAEQTRQLLGGRGILAVNLIGGAGCGKTALLEATLPRLHGHLAPAVLEGDIATTRDSERIARLDVPVIQLLTDGACHLNAELVHHAARKLPLDSVQVIFVENVGNPVCPAQFDIGEHVRVAVLSVTEGDDKPEKYPALFSTAHAVVITKHDLLSVAEFDLQRVREAIRLRNHAAPVFVVSARAGTGLEPWCDWLMERAASLRQAGERKQG